MHVTQLPVQVLWRLGTRWGENRRCTKKHAPSLKWIFSYETTFPRQHTCSGVSIQRILEILTSLPNTSWSGERESRRQTMRASLPTSTTKRSWSCRPNTTSKKKPLVVRSLTSDMVFGRRILKYETKAFKPLIFVCVRFELFFRHRIFFSNDSISSASSALPSSQLDRRWLTHLLQN